TTAPRIPPRRSDRPTVLPQRMMSHPCMRKHPTPPASLPRRRALRLLAGAAAFAMAEPSSTAAVPGTMLRRPIHRSGEQLPVVSLGTYRTFDVGPRNPQLKELAEVLRLFTRMGGSVIDSSPMYGEAERTIGDLAADTGLHDRL